MVVLVAMDSTMPMLWAAVKRYLATWPVLIAPIVVGLTGAEEGGDEGEDEDSEEDHEVAPIDLSPQTSFPSQPQLRARSGERAR